MLLRTTDTVNWNPSGDVMCSIDRPVKLASTSMAQSLTQQLSRPVPKRWQRRIQELWCDAIDDVRSADIGGDGQDDCLPERRVVDGQRIQAPIDPLWVVHRGFHGPLDGVELLSERVLRLHTILETFVQRRVDSGTSDDRGEASDARQDGIKCLRIFQPAVERRAGEGLPLPQITTRHRMEEKLAKVWRGASPIGIETTEYVPGRKAILFEGETQGPEAGVSLTIPKQPDAGLGCEPGMIQLHQLSH